jgi:hypothetical protein
VGDWRNFGVISAQMGASATTPEPSYDASAMWELIVFLVLLKIPVAYLCAVVWYAVRATPVPPAGASLTPVRPRPDDHPSPRRPAGRRLDPNGRSRSRGRGPRRPARKAAR